MSLSRKVVRKVLRSEETAFEYKRSVQPRPKLGAWRDEFERLLAAKAARGSRERVTVLRIFEDLRALGYEGGYDAVPVLSLTHPNTTSEGTPPANPASCLEAHPAECTPRSGSPLSMCASASPAG